MIRRSIITGASFAGLAVILGAFGAHALKDTPGMTTESLQVFDTGVRYQFYHSIALILIGILCKVFGESKLVNAAYTLFTLGILFFSGSVYLLSTREVTGIEWPWLGPITPLGGLCFITGWTLIIISFIKNKQV